MNEDSQSPDVINPYEYNRPVGRSEDFAGRHAILKNIDYALALATSERPQYRNLAITGPRGIGKTSLLNMITSMASEVHGFQAVRLDLNNDIVSDHARLFESIVGAVVDEQRRHRSALARAFLRSLRSTSLEVELRLVVATLKAAQRDNAPIPQKKLRDALEQLLTSP
jgi:Holliday junction resolvasome RuvABC ATP-dependent DNA helicase subunit